MRDAVHLLVRSSAVILVLLKSLLTILHRGFAVCATRFKLNMVLTILDTFLQVQGFRTECLRIQQQVGQDHEGMLLATTLLSVLDPGDQA